MAPIAKDLWRSVWVAPDRSVVVRSSSDRAEDAGFIGAAYLRRPGHWPAGVGFQGAVQIEDDVRALHMVAVDPIGTVQAYWTERAGTLDVAGSPQALPSGASLADRIDPQAVYNYTFFHSIPGPRTIYRDVFKVPNGHVLIRQGRSLRIERFWRPEFSERTDRELTDLARQLRAALDDAVRSCALGARQPGAFLSGGLDSSTVSGLLASQVPGAATFSMGFDADGYDEMEYARIASRHFHTTPHEYYVTPEDVLKSAPRVAAAFAEPFGNSSAAAVFECARLAREAGVDRLLAGDGGDELFGGNERYAKQMVFERYQRVPAFARHALLEPVVRSAARVTRAFPIGKADSYIQQANVPLPDRLQTYNYLHRHSPEEIFTAAFIAESTQTEPLDLLRDEYACPTDASSINRMLFLDWKFTLHDNDLVKVNQMCGLAGVEVAYPMLDARVVDLSLLVPTRWKVRGSELRWFYKQAFAGFLPREIIHKTKHGFGLPFGVWTATHPGLRRLSEETLHSLSSRGYFRPDFVRRLLEMHQNVHAKFYGELVWILMMLELWLQAHAPNAKI